MYAKGEASKEVFRVSNVHPRGAPCTSQASLASKTHINNNLIHFYRKFVSASYEQKNTTIVSRMPERRAASSSTSNRSTTGVRRNLFHQHLSRRPTTSSTSTSAETVRLETEHDSETSDIVIRNKDGEFDIGDPQMQSLDEQEEGSHDANEDESM
jgi:hypothetical protein